MQPLRLLAVIEAATITGPAKNLLQFARLARLRDYDPAVEVSIAVFQRAGASELFLETCRQASIPFRVIAERGRFDRSVVPALRSAAAELRPDVIQSHAVKSHFLVRQSRLHRQLPWVAFHHGYTWPDLKVRLYNQLDRWSLRAARQVLTVSRPFRQELIRAGVRQERVEVIHNAIDADWGRRGAAPPGLREQLGIAPNEQVILMVGRLSREKDHHTLLEAAVQLRTAAPQLRPRLLLVGDGPERARIERAAAELGLDGALTFTGQVPSAEPYYSIADVAVLSSLSEGSPNALLEAMAARVPAVATNVGGVPEIVNHRESALLIPPRDRSAMAGAIAEVLSDESLRHGLIERAGRAIAERHTPDSRVRRLIGIYRRLLGR